MLHHINMDPNLSVWAKTWAQSVWAFSDDLVALRLRPIDSPAELGQDFCLSLSVFFRFCLILGWFIISWDNENCFHQSPKGIHTNPCSINTWMSWQNDLRDIKKHSQIKIIFKHILFKISRQKIIALCNVDLLKGWCLMLVSFCSWFFTGMQFCDQKKTFALYLGQDLGG